MTDTSRERVRPGSRGPGRGRQAPPPVARSRVATWAWWVAVSGLSVLTVLAIVVYFTPVVGVRSVRVTGAQALSEQQVRDAAAIRVGEPMARVDTGEIERRLRAVPRIASADATLSWPSTVDIAVHERTPVAFAMSSAGVQLIDATGMVFATVPQPPPGIPELRVREAAPDDPATKSAITVLAALSPEVRRELQAVSADTPSYVRLVLAGDREVRWGDAVDSELKAAVLGPLLTRPGKVYDVTTPVLPTVA